MSWGELLEVCAVAWGIIFALYLMTFNHMENRKDKHND